MIVIRTHESPESVSMRDVKRCIKLEQFFREHHIARESNKVRAKVNANKPPSRKRKKRGPYKKHSGKRMNNLQPHPVQATPPEDEDEIDVLLRRVNQVPPNLSSIILALAICYHTRLGSTRVRAEYRRIL